MKAEVKSIHAPEVNDLKSYTPQDRECFALQLQVMVGPKGMEGEESFDLTVCTPKWLLKQYDKDDIVVGRHHIIVFEYHYHKMIDFIKRLIESCEGDDWEEVAQKVSRYGMWEFEDYTGIGSGR